MTAVAEIVRVPFQGTEIHTVLVDGEPQVVLRPSIENMGLDASAQMKKLKTRSWATVVETATVAEDGRSRFMATVDLQTWAMLLANIDENRVAPHLKQLVVGYQLESAQALRDYWTKGGTINPRASEDQLEDLNSRIQGQLGTLAAARELVNPSWLEAKARHLIAQALGEEPEVDAKDKPLTVMDYLAERGVKGKAVLRTFSPRFGKRLIFLYTQKTGEPPKKVERFVDEVYRMVACYTHADRPLFDQVWNSLAAEGLTP